MSIREEVLQILRSSEAARIRFSFQSVYRTPVSVDHTTFIRVVSAIESNRIEVTSEGISENHNGNYNGDRENGGILRARSIRNRRYNRSSVIHESVHASFDLTGTTIAEVDNEVAAYLANTLYLRFTHYPITRFADDPRTSRRLYESLWRAAGSIEHNGSVSETQIEQIRQRLIEHPDYQHLMTEGCITGESGCFYTIRVYNS